MTRPSLDEWFLSLAAVAAQRSTCLRAQVGCAIARGNRLLALGYGGSPANDSHCLDVGCEIGDTGGCVRTRGYHAEQNALQWATAIDVCVEGATLYTTLSPCVMCAAAAGHAGIARVVYRDAYRKSDGVDWLREHGVAVEKL